MSNKNDFNIVIWDEHYTEGDQILYGQNISHGTTINRIETAQYNNSFYQFSALIIWKLYLNMALDFEANAIEISQLFQRSCQKNKTSDKKRIYNLETLNRNDLLDYFKHIISAYIFSFNTLEAYINSKIDLFNPSIEDFITIKELTKTTHTGLIKTKNDLIKECSIEDKLYIIIPYILQKHSVTYKINLADKNNFQTILKFIRNELTHPKSLKHRSSAKNGTFKVSKFWNTLIPCFKDNNTIILGFYPAKFVKGLIETIEQKFSKN